MVTEMFTTKEQIVKFLTDSPYTENEYKIHDDLTVEFFNDFLILNDMNIKIIPFKYKNVKYISLSNTKIKNFEDINLSEGIELVFANGTPIKSTKGLPSTVKILDIHGTQVEHLEDLPKELKELWASKTPLKSTKGIPNTVKVLDISRTQVRDFHVSIHNLEFIDISDTPLSAYELDLKFQDSLPTGCKFNR